MKTLLVYDAFFSHGQSEKINLEIATLLTADILTATYSFNSYIPEYLGYHGKIIEVYKTFERNPSWIQTQILSWKFFKNRSIFENYDTFFLCDRGLRAIPYIGEGANISYFLQKMPSFLREFSEEEIAEIPYLFRWFYDIKKWFSRKIFISRIKRVKRIFTNSAKNKAELIKITGRSDIVVLHPAVNTSQFHPVKQKMKFVFEEHNNIISVVKKEISEYYLSTARLTSKKRVEDIIRAFTYLPYKNLVVLYREEDTKKNLCMEIARGHENIFFKKIIYDGEIPPIIAHSIATISIAREDDFALSAIESMACGIPVIGTNERGYKEIITHGKTGTLLKKEFIEYEIIDAINLMTVERAADMKDACIKKASEFSMENFSKELKKYI